MGGGVLLYNRRASEYLIETLKGVDTKLPKDLRDYAKRKIGAAGVAAIERDLANPRRLPSWLRHLPASGSQTCLSGRSIRNCRSCSIPMATASS